MGQRRGLSELSRHRLKPVHFHGINRSSYLNHLPLKQSVAGSDPVYTLQPLQEITVQVMEVIQPRKHSQFRPELLNDEIMGVLEIRSSLLSIAAIGSLLVR